MATKKSSKSTKKSSASTKRASSKSTQPTSQTQTNNASQSNFPYGLVDKDSYKAFSKYLTLPALKSTLQSPLSSNIVMKFIDWCEYIENLDLWDKSAQVFATAKNYKPYPYNQMKELIKEKNFLKYREFVKEFSKLKLKNDVQSVGMALKFISSILAVQKSVELMLVMVSGQMPIKSAGVSTKYLSKYEEVHDLLSQGKKGVEELQKITFTDANNKKKLNILKRFLGLDPAKN